MAAARRRGGLDGGAQHATRSSARAASSAAAASAKPASTAVASAARRVLSPRRSASRGRPAADGASRSGAEGCGDRRRGGRAARSGRGAGHRAPRRARRSASATRSASSATVASSSASAQGLLLGRARLARSRSASELVEAGGRGAEAAARGVGERQVQDSMSSVPAACATTAGLGVQVAGLRRPGVPLQLGVVEPAAERLLVVASGAPGAADARCGWCSEPQTGQLPPPTARLLAISAAMPSSRACCSATSSSWRPRQTETASLRSSCATTRSLRTVEVGGRPFRDADAAGVAGGRSPRPGRAPLPPLEPGGDLRAARLAAASATASALGLGVRETRADAARSASRGSSARAAAASRTAAASSASLRRRRAPRRRPRAAWRPPTRSPVARAAAASCAARAATAARCSGTTIRARARRRRGTPGRRSRRRDPGAGRARPGRRRSGRDAPRWCGRRRGRCGRPPRRPGSGQRGGERARRGRGPTTSARAPGERSTPRAAGRDASAVSLTRWTQRVGGALVLLAAVVQRQPSVAQPALDLLEALGAEELLEQLVPVLGAANAGTPGSGPGGASRPG